MLLFNWMQKITFKNFVWINLLSSEAENIRKVCKDYNFHHLAIEDCFSQIQQPKIDDYDDYLFMVLHLPRHIKKSGRTIALELDVFLGKSFLITVHNGDLKSLNAYFTKITSDPSLLKPSNTAYLLYEILSETFSSCFPMLQKIAEKLDRIEDDLYEDQSKKTLEEISVVAQDIINFRRIIRPQRYFIQDLEATEPKFIAEKFDIYFDDIADKIDRIWDLLDNYKEVCEVLMRTNESMLTQRLNEVMKILTIISVIMLPLTVITGFYGMNIVGLPFANYHLAAEIIFGSLVAVVLGMLAYFKIKKWM